jgi:hypothetical protein
MVQGFYAMNRSIRNTKGGSAGAGKTTKNLAVSESSVTDEFLRTTGSAHQSQ